eukprot:XP_014064342.1 PREDICTED: LIM domain only protein 3-like [Salmo salar]
MLGVYRRSVLSWISIYLYHAGCLQEVCSLLDLYLSLSCWVSTGGLFSPVLTVRSSCLCLFCRLFGVTGNCAACSKLIPAFEMVMRAKENVYHLDCFACQLCNQRFCVGDKFFLKNNMILCQTDYEEGLMKEGYAPQVR